MGSVKCCCFLLMCMQGKRKGLVELKSSYSVLGKRETETETGRVGWFRELLRVAGAQLK